MISNDENLLNTQEQCLQSCVVYYHDDGIDDDDDDDFDDNDDGFDDNDDVMGGISLLSIILS
jgi:hypothetical protein